MPKHLEPYKGEGVKEDVFVCFMLLHPEMSALIWQGWQKYISTIKIEVSWRERKRGWKDFYYSPLVQMFENLINLELNYKDSTVKAGHIVRRAMHAYRNHQSKIICRTNKKHQTETLATTHHELPENHRGNTMPG